MKCNKENIFVIIPVWNEGKVISSVIESVKKEGFKNIIVVNDGSTDNTAEVLSTIRDIYTAEHSLNRGKGVAVMTGFELAKTLGAENVVTIDGDGQHNPKDIEKLINKRNEGYDVVLGSRLLNASDMPFHKKIHNNIGNMILYLLYGIYVKDSQSGFRLFSRKTIDLIRLEIIDRYAFESEVIREIYINRLDYVEVPIEVIYTEYSTSKSGNKQTFIGGVKLLFKMIASI